VIGQATSVETVPSIVRVKSVQVRQVATTNTATSITQIKTRVLGQSTELDTANSFAGLRSNFKRAVETDIAQPISVLKLKRLNQVTETDVARKTFWLPPPDASDAGDDDLLIYKGHIQIQVGRNIIV
jgi:hypothetical protein